MNTRPPSRPSTIQEIANNTTRKGQIDVILLDFSKAFDKKPHHHLLHKLNFYGVRESTLCWIESFLSRKGSNLSCWMVGLPNLQKQMYCLGCSNARSSGPYFSWPLLITRQSPQNTQMPDYLLTIAFSIDMSRQVKTKPSSRKIYQRWRDGKKPGK